MSEQEPLLPSKHRLDVIDTAQLQQKEKRALKWLGILLGIALIYEGWDLLLSPLSMPEIPIPELNTAMRRAFPSRRVGRLVQVLRNLQTSQPLVRDALTPLIEELGWIKDQDPARAGLALLQKRLVKNLTGLWEVFHSPLWEDRKPFAPVILEIRTLFALLRETPPEESPIPNLPIGPRPLLPLETPARDLFRFEAPAIPETPPVERRK